MRSSVLYMYLCEFLCKLNKTYNKCDMQQRSLFYIHYLLLHIFLGEDGTCIVMTMNYSLLSRYAIDKLYIL